MEFIYMERKVFGEYAERMFQILSGNMTRIAPTGNSIEEDRKTWIQAMTAQLADPERKVVLIFCDGMLAGYFQYLVRNGVFHMEEIQFDAVYQGTGTFRCLYGFLIGRLVPAPEFVEAFANKQNAKSIGIQRRMGMEVVGENRSGRSWRLRGRYEDLVKWYASGNVK